MAIKDVTYEHFPHGELPPIDHFEAGDYVLVSAGRWKQDRRGRDRRGHVPIGSRLIQIGQGLRFRGDKKRFAHWNHAAWVSDGELIEVRRGKVRATPFETYRDIEFTLVHSNLTEDQRKDAEKFVRWALTTEKKFAWLGLASVILSLLTAMKVSFGTPGTMFCSGLVAAALGTYEWRDQPALVLPAHLAKYADITL